MLLLASKSGWSRLAHCRCPHFCSETKGANFSGHLRQEGQRVLNRVLLSKRVWVISYFSRISLGRRLGLSYLLQLQVVVLESSFFRVSWLLQWIWILIMLLVMMLRHERRVYCADRWASLSSTCYLATRWNEAIIGTGIHEIAITQCSLPTFVQTGLTRHQYSTVHDSV
jgi:hypothetical protein